MKLRSILRTAFVAMTGVSVIAACAPVKKAPLPPCGSAAQFGATHGSVIFDSVGTHSFTVPAGITALAVDAYGAEGGGSEDGAEIQPGGLGGRATAVIAVRAGETLQVNVGGQGADGMDAAGGAAGGSNGGGSAGTVSAVPGGGGGGASDLRCGSFGLGDRAVVAGGGGGAGGLWNTLGVDGVGGPGGGLAGGDGAEPSAGFGGGPGLGGTQSTGGAGGANNGAGSSGSSASGTAGTGGASTGGGPYNASGGGGGGGYFGGGAGGSVTGGGGHNGGGGGGSGFGPASATFETGVRAGDGRVVIAF